MEKTHLNLRSPILPKEEKIREQKKEVMEKEEVERNGRKIEEINRRDEDTIDEGDKISKNNANNPFQVSSITLL